MIGRFRCFVSIALLLTLTQTTPAQTTYTWSYAGTNWNDATNWSPGGGPPTSSDTALFDHYPGTSFTTQPTLTASTSVGRMLFLGPRSIANYQFTGGGNTLTLGTGAAMSESALSFRGGFGTTIVFSNLQTNIATGTSFAGTAATLGAMEFNQTGSRFSLMNSSIVRLTNAANTQNYDLTISGAQIALAAGTQLTNGVGSNTSQQGRLTFQGGGILTVSGATSGTTNFTMNQVAAQSGNTQITLSRGGATALNLTLGNSTLQAGIDGFVRDFNGTALSALSDGTIQINLNDTIPLTSGATGPSNVFLAAGASGIAQTNNVITRGSSSNTNSPYVIITGTVAGNSGTSTRFASFSTGSNLVLGQAGTTRTETNLGSAALNENTIYRQSSGTLNASLANSINVQTLVLEPGTNNQTLNLNSNTITTNGIAVSGGTTNSVFTLTGGSLAGTAASDRHFFVTNSGVTLAVSSNFAGSNNSSIIKAGAGILSLTGTTDQMSFPAITDIVINSGILRARIEGDQKNFGTTGNSLNFRGGVLEIDTQGIAGPTPTATFSRSLGTGFGQVNWTGGIPFEVRQERGSGGFAALNGTVNINIGGAKATLIWNGSDATNRFFLRSGNALTLGSATQAGILDFQNGIGLDDGSASAPLETRYINIATPSTSASIPNRQVILSGVISGGPNTSLAYGGTGLVEVTAANTYSGGTIIDQAYVQVNNTTGSATGSGSVIVTRGILIGNGTIAPAAGKGVTVTGPLNIGGFLITDNTFGTPGHMKIGTDGVDNPVTFNPGGVFGSRIHGSTFNPNGGAGSYGRLTIRGTGAITITGATLSTGLSNTFTPTSGDAFGLIDNQTANPIVGTFNGIVQDGIINITREDNSTYGTARISYTGNIVGASVSPTGGNDVVIYGFVPVPEPGFMLAAISISGLVGVRIRRRFSRSL